MNKDGSIIAFENRKIRREWNEKEEKWYFSVVDVIQALTQQQSYQAARNYWKVFKKSIKKRRKPGGYKL